MSVPLDWSWPAEALAELVSVTARSARLGVHDHAAALATPGAVLAGDEGAERAWLDAVAEVIQVEAEPIDCSCGELVASLARMSPAIARVAIDGERRYLGLVAASGGRVVLVTPALARVKVRATELADALTGALTSTTAPLVDWWMQIAEVPPKRAARARAALLELTLRDNRVSGLWLLRDDPGASFLGQIRRRGFPGIVARYVALALVQAALGMAAWVVLGRGALLGAVEPGWLYAWLLLSIGTVPLQVAASHLAGRLSLETAEVLKQRLLCGALRMDPGEVRARGSGGLLATVTESEAIEAASLTGAFGALAAVVQLLVASAVLWAGASGGLLVTLLAAWCVGVTLAVVVVMRRRLSWTQERFALSNDLVENILGHRTRLAQAPAPSYHPREDARLERYLRSSESMNGLQTALSGVPARGWLAVAILGLVPSILHAGGDHASLLVAIGGIVQAESGIASLVASVTGLLSVVSSWRSVGPLFDAATRRDLPGAPVAAAAQETASAPGDAAIALEARGVSFQYSPTTAAVVRGCDLVLRDGDRMLLEGRSGGGKSTLAGLLSGLHVPQAGFLAVRGLDRKTVGGTRWRQRVASAPQFHENHILTGSLGFNLLMGRAWPPSNADLTEAEGVCRELGLGELLAKMPSRLSQIVGETGWQLSHGERSRIFLARALLQRTDVLVLDESFGALDPLTLKTCLDCVLARAKTLVVIAHP